LKPRKPQLLIAIFDSWFQKRVNAKIHLVIEQVEIQDFSAESFWIYVWEKNRIKLGSLIFS
jgi:hypothetical protein